MVGIDANGETQLTGVTGVFQGKGGPVTQILLRDVFRLNFSVTINQRRIAGARVPAVSPSVSLGR
jgi:hypothetical protein